jgi:uncharacterized protein (UPF0305 family)
MKHKAYKKEYFEQTMKWFEASAKNLKNEDKAKENEEEKENAKGNKI